MSHDETVRRGSFTDFHGIVLGIAVSSVVAALEFCSMYKRGPTHGIRNVRTSTVVVSYTVYFLITAPHKFKRHLEVEQRFK